MDLPSDFIDQIKKVYPRRNGGQGWGYVKRRIPELVKQGHSFADLLDGAKRYGDFCRATQHEYVRMAKTFFGPDHWWEEDYELPDHLKPRKQWEPQKETEEERSAAILAFERDKKRYGYE